jgi:hypothetical protein
LKVGHFIFYFFLGFEETQPLKSVICKYRWASKILVVPSFYKRYTSWLELETYYTNFKFFTITLHLRKKLDTSYTLLGQHTTNYKWHQTFVTHPSNSSHPVQRWQHDFKIMLLLSTNTKNLQISCRLFHAKHIRAGNGHVLAFARTSPWHWIG